MTSPFRWIGQRCACAWLIISLVTLVPAVAYATKDALDTPPFRAPKASGAVLLDIVRTGKRLIAAGEHGIIIYSDTNGKTWQQADVPASVTLTAVRFPTRLQGWAVGHDGVILHSEDGGARWSKQFDGNRANALVLKAAEQREKSARAAFASHADGHPAAEWKAAERALEDAQAGAKFGPSRPLFDIWLKNEREGIAVGSFGQMFHTDDGGGTWELWSDRIDNPDNLHYNAISASAAGTLLIAGEAGKVYRSADGGRSWTTIDTGYQGQLYGVLGIETGGMETLIAYGFGGHVFRSIDNGAHWQPVALTERKPVVAGLVLPDRGVVLLTNDGKLLHSHDEGQSFTTESSGVGLSVAALAWIDSGSVIVAGVGGTRIVSINRTTKAGQP